MTIKIVSLIRTLNEADKIDACCKAYSEFCDAVLVADGGSTDDTIERALKYPKVKVREFQARVTCKNGILRNPDGPHLNFLYAWGEEEGADWIVSQDCDQRPNLFLKQDARSIMEKTNKGFLLGTQIYLWKKTQYFPQMSKSSGSWTKGIWAWRADLHIRAIDRMPHYEFSIDGGMTAINPERSDMAEFLSTPPYCHLHCGWETEEEVDSMLEYYRTSGLVSNMRHPLSFGGEPEPILDWMIE